MHFILYKYIARQYFLSVLFIAFAFAGLVLFFDILELARITYNTAITIYDVIGMCLMKNYSRVQKVLPFVILVGTILLYRKLGVRGEMAAMRASGLTSIQITLPAMFIVILFSILHIVFLHQLSASLLERYQYYEAKFMKNNDSLVSVSQSGLWFKYQMTNEYVMVHSQKVSVPTNEMYDVEIYYFDENGKFLKRLDASNVEVLDSSVLAYNAVITDASYSTHYHDTFAVPIRVRLEQITDNLMLPETMTILRLYDFITFANESGFSSVKYRLYLAHLLFSPLMCIAMMFLGYGFCSVLPRFRRSSLLTLSIVFICFVIYFMVDFFSAIAMTNSIPVIAAVIAPIIIAAMFSYYCILHYEFT